MASKIPPRLYWDTSVWVEYFNDAADGHWNQPIRTQLAFAKRGRIQIVTSVMAVTEVVFVKPLEKPGKVFLGGHEAEMDKVWNDYPAVLLIRSDTHIARMARDMHRWALQKQIKQLDGPDYVHIATAMYTKAVTAIHTIESAWFPYQKFAGIPITYPEAPAEPTGSPTLLDGTNSE